MSNLGNKYKVGVFVVIAAIFLILSLTMLGIMDYIKPKYMFMTVVDGSVQGLEVGAKVKINGVTIGKVSAIQIGLHGSVVYVYMEFIASSLKSDITNDLISHQDKYRYFKKFVAEKVKKGLCCQLHYSGITGTLYQELRYAPPGQKFKKFNLPPGHPPYVPSITPVLMGDILKNLNRTLANTAKIDLVPLLKKFERLASDGSNLLQSDELQSSLHDLKQVMQNLDYMTTTLRSHVDNKNVASLLKNSNQTLLELNKTLRRAQQFMVVVTKELDAAKVKNTADATRKFMTVSSSAIQDLRANLQNNLTALDTTINQANATLRAAQELLNTLNTNPSAVLYGNKPTNLIHP